MYGKCVGRSLSVEKIIDNNSAKYFTTRGLKAIPWDALAREGDIGMNCEAIFQKRVRVFPDRGFQTREN